MTIRTGDFVATRNPDDSPSSNKGRVVAVYGTGEALVKWARGSETVTRIDRLVVLPRR